MIFRIFLLPLVLDSETEPENSSSESSTGDQKEGSRQKRKPVLVGKIIYNAYHLFGTITNEEIEALRFKYRIKVIQNLEDSTKRTVLRNVGYVSFEEWFYTVFNS